MPPRGISGIRHQGWDAMPPVGTDFRKTWILIEIFWGEPLAFVVSADGDVQRFTTLEQARHWLRKKWPIQDTAHQSALHKIDAAMDCIGTVGSARRAFISAARTAGFVQENLIVPSGRIAPA